MHWMFRALHLINQLEIGMSHQSPTWQICSTTRCPIQTKELSIRLSNQSGWPYNWSAFAPNQAPSNLLLSQSQFVENLDGSTIGTFSAFDPIQWCLSYWVTRIRPTNFSLQSTNGVLRTATNFDFENNATSFQLSVKATDSLVLREGNFTITLMNDPSDPFIPQALSIQIFKLQSIYGSPTKRKPTPTATSALEYLGGDGYVFCLHSRSTFNEDIGSWDTSSVKDMNQMFNGASSSMVISNGMYRLLLTWYTCLMEQLRLIKILILGMYQMWLSWKHVPRCKFIQPGY